jgi:carbon-monoxide dehydrogenase catalytic subunit
MINMDTLSERAQRMPPCPIGMRGLCCKCCLMGPCRLLKPEDRGVCGADGNLVSSRNILRFVAGGASAHSGHAYHLLQYLGREYPEHYIEKKAPKELVKMWERLGIVPKVRYEHFKDISEALHMTTMGVNSDYRHNLAMAMKLGIIDGYYGLYLSTELEDEAFGRPSVKTGQLNLGVIRPDKINIAVHGHEPELAEAVVAEAAKKENSDINLVGVCCTGATLLAKHGVPLAANVILQEDVIATGMVEAMAVDVQCIMPSVADLAECFHTKIITTNEICRIPNAEHIPVTDRRSAKEAARAIIEIARERRKLRKKSSFGPKKASKKEAVVGFSQFNLPLDRWAKDIKAGKLRGIIAVVGCESPRVTEDWVSFYRKMAKDHIILATGCMAFRLGAEGLLDGKRFFHLGSCVNNSRVAEVFRIVAEKLGMEMGEAPFLVSCPEPMTEKAVSIGFFFAATGVDVHVGYPFLLAEKTKVTNFLATALRDNFRSRIFLETKPERLAAQLNVCKSPKCVPDEIRRAMKKIKSSKDAEPLSLDSFKNGICDGKTK